MTLEGVSKAFKHGKANTLYFSVPSQVACDSKMPFKVGDVVRVRIDGASVIITRKD